MGGLCPACLLEGALVEAPAADGEGAVSKPAIGGEGWRLSIHLPLGSSEHASVFLVHDERQPTRLLRLKCWRVPAPEGFLARYARIHERLAAWTGGGVARPLTASLDRSGRLAVLSEFVQGTSVTEAVATGSLDPDEAVELIRPLRGLLSAAHEDGLAHGAVAPSNVIAHPQAGTACLLDFGVGAAWSPRDQAGLVAADRRGWAALVRQLRRHRSRSRDRPL
jgi:serine/threonine protein kinase